jgi:hypothetical protein
MAVEEGRRRCQGTCSSVVTQGGDSTRWSGFERPEEYASKTFHGTKKQAQMALAAFVTEVSKDRTVVSVEQISVHQVLERWLQTSKRRLSPATVDRYRVATPMSTPSSSICRWLVCDRITSRIPTATRWIKGCRVRRSANWTGR